MKSGNVYKHGGGKFGSIIFAETTTNGRFNIYEDGTGKNVIYGNIINNILYLYDAETSEAIGGNLNGNKINFAKNSYEIDNATF